MTRASRLALRSLFSAGVLGALAFGAAQLHAAPPQGAERACFDAYCDDLCRMRGYTYGFCDTTLHQCVCVRI